MSSFEDAEAVIQLMRDFFVTGDGLADARPPRDNCGASALSASASNSSSSGQPSGSSTYAACGCQSPDSSISIGSDGVPSDALSSHQASRVVGIRRGGGAAEADSSSDRSADMQDGGGTHNNGIGRPDTAKDRKGREQAGACSSPEEPRTPTQEESSNGHSRVSTAQTVMQAFRRSAAALSKAQPQSSEAVSSRDAVAGAADGPHVQGLWLYPIKSCAAQVSACFLACGI